VQEGDEGISFGEACVITKELQAVALMGRDQHFQKPAPEQAVEAAGRPPRDP